ncbi:GntR family transcriptional regulator [Bradyrhizobium sp. LHD-71]|uniref:GntR family transcriptional regulator n=1 Tax=Bradyrhizobium sp. LHD-71 TaxID=3072141 RepID=UPI00280C6317|nr:GntR family transcriptional regulator [Bradyrhizobium sp. LHD-71]MDQ8730882.1 GntR family transcriptional regulator [Bradyrhizobium sp. LHD-71]
MTAKPKTPAAKRGRPRKVRSFLADDSLKLGRTGLHEQAAQRLRDMIIRGDLPPGSALVEKDLSEALGISRTPLREAMKLLAQQGLIELRANRSACVRTMRLSEISDLFEALAGIERLSAELAASRITASRLDELRTLQEAIEQHHRDGERMAYYAANRDIHRAIVLAANNVPLADAHAALLARSEQVRYFALRLEDRWGQSIEEHRRILEAIEKRDSRRAGELLAAHVAHTAEVVARSIEKSSDAPRNAA